MESLRWPVVDIRRPYDPKPPAADRDDAGATDRDRAGATDRDHRAAAGDLGRGATGGRGRAGKVGAIPTIDARWFRSTMEERG